MTSLGEIAAALRVDEAEIAFLEDASTSERKVLLGAIEDAEMRRDRELRDAIDSALGFVPKPLRGRIVNLLRGGRG